MRWSEVLAFVREFHRSFRTTGALLPSSRALARRMAWPLQQHVGPKRVLEVGPGTGVFTAQIVRHLGPEDRLDLVEANPTFVAMLKQRFARDSAFRRVRDRCRLVEGYAPEAIDSPPYDYIVSGLPLNNFEPKQVERVLAALMDALVPGGTLSYFEYLYVRKAKAAVAGTDERRRLSEIAEVTGSFIRRYRAAVDHVFLNVPPAAAHHLRRPAVSVSP